MMPPVHRKEAQPSAAAFIFNGKQKTAIMLGAIRKRSAGIVVKGLLGLLILSFAVWGIADVFSPGGSSNAVAKVGEVEVGPDSVRREYQREIDRLSRILGTRIEPEQARALGIVQGVIARVVDRILFDLGAKDLGILIGDDLIRNDIQTQKAFQDDKGQFDRLRFQQIMQANGLSEGDFIALARGDISRGHFLSMVSAQPEAPKSLTRILHAYRGEKRIAESVTIAFAEAADPGVPGADALAKFHRDNASMFTAPEYRSLKVLRLKADDLAREIAVSDDAIAEAYEARLDEFSEPEKRVLQHIRFKDEDSAGKAHAMLGQGADFAKVAAEVAGMNAGAIELGAMKKTQLLPGLAEPAFALALGAYSEPLNSALGWHILRLTSVVPASQKPLAEVKTLLRDQIATEKAIDSLYEMANKVEDHLGGGASVEETARTLDLSLDIVDAIDANGFDAAGKPVAGLPDSQFLSIAFSTPEFSESPLTEDGSDGYYIVRVEKVTAPALRPLASVQGEVAMAWAAERKRDAAKRTAEALLAEMKGGGDLFKLAAASGRKVVTSEPFQRSSRVQFPVSVVGALFQGSPGASAIGESADGYVVARLKKIVPLDAGAAAVGEKALAEQLASAIRGDLLEQLANGLRRKFPVTVFDDAVNALF